jgi:formylglycine-generating enzyme required for sulfatase activity
MLHHPVVNVTLEDAIAFCAWTRLRLLTATEWKWAALGRPIRPLSGRHGLPSYPWGNEPPSPERCVWAGHPEFGLQQLGRPYRQHEASTAPVVVPETIDDAISRLENVGARPGPRPVLLPARPLGASWVEAHDLCGNVWELIESDPNNPLVLGGSFRSVGESLEESLGSVRVGVPVGPRISPDQDDSTGYRVALSAVT